MTREKILSRRWDTVVLQEQSLRPAYDAATVCRDTVPYLDILVQLIRDNSPNTRIQFYDTWARPHGSSEDCSAGLDQFCHFSSMQTALTQSYTQFACLKAVATVAPVGEAFRYIHDNNNNNFFLSLYDNNGGDHHASALGSYLSAATHYAAMMNTSVVGNTAVAGLDADLARRMQEAATETWFSRDWVSDQHCQECLCGCN